MKGINNIPLSRTAINNIQVNVLIKIIPKLYKPGDIIRGDLFTDDIEKKVFVISNDIIFEIVNRHYVKNDKKTNVSVKKLNFKSTSGCSYFLSEGEIL